MSPIFEQLLLGLLAQPHLPPVFATVVQILQMLLVQTTEVALPLSFPIVPSVFFLNLTPQKSIEFVVLPFVSGLVHVEPEQRASFEGRQSEVLGLRGGLFGRLRDL